jgi:hypothetical protein
VGSPAVPGSGPHQLLMIFMILQQRSDGDRVRNLMVWFIIVCWSFYINLEIAAVRLPDEVVNNKPM